MTVGNALTYVLTTPGPFMSHGQQDLGQGSFLALFLTPLKDLTSLPLPITGDFLSPIHLQKYRTTIN